ncbi:MAG: hypothetical protein J6P73_01500 [Bacteroidales bacterium]|nr:hypothetical protein [Bacteroidales bacterium]
MTADEHIQAGKDLYYNRHKYYEAYSEFAKAEQMGDANAWAYLGEMLYNGHWTRDRKPDVNGALSYWMTGIKEGSELCQSFYDAHKDEMRHDPKKIVFENGDMYYGDVDEEGLPHGGGHMDYSDYASHYDGLWKHGKRCGKGHYYHYGYRYSYDYKGEWLDDMEHGQGTSVKTDEVGIHLSSVSERYTGGFRQGKYHGHGVFVKSHYDGEFTNGADRFEGDFVDGAAIGLGVWEYANGDRFEGEFATYGKPSVCSTPIQQNGHGIYTFANGQQFEGDWSDNHFLPESYQPDPLLETPTLIVSEHHEGLDWNYSGTFLMPAKVGVMLYDEAAAISNSGFKMDDGFLNILKVTPDSVTYEVKSMFTPDQKAFQDTIHRGETKEYKDSSEHTVTIEGDEIEYTYEDSLGVICK